MNTKSYIFFQTAISPILPPLCFGVTSLVSSGLLLLTPETSTLALPDTIKQIDDSTLQSEEPKSSLSYAKSENNLGFEPDV